MSHRHLMSRMGKVAAHVEEPPEEPHDDWRVFPNYRNAETRDDLTPEQKAETYHEWHPGVGESFVQYIIFPPNDNEPRGWTAIHNGINKGMMSGDSGHGNTYLLNDYDPADFDYVGDYFKTPEEGRREVEKYHAERYSQPAPHDYDIDQIMRDHDLRNRPSSSPLDDDFGDIFGGGS